MRNEEEVNLPENGGTVEVSSDAKALLASARKKKLADRTPEEKQAIKEYNAAARRKSDKKIKTKNQAAAQKAESEVEISVKDAKAILREERKIQNDHVVDTIVSLAEVAARANKLVFNRYLFTHGLRAALRFKETEVEEAPPDVEVEEVLGEILYRTDLYALWDMGFWRQPDVPFETWLAHRFRYKSSAFALSQLLNKIDFGATHESWERFLPRWSPLGLRPNYTQQDALAWLGQQHSDTEGDKRRFLLVASRNSMKSTFIRIHALQLTLNCPDSSVLVVSETNKLSKKAMKEYKGYLTKAANNPTKFQQYFAESAYRIPTQASRTHTRIRWHTWGCRKPLVNLPAWRQQTLVRVFGIAYSMTQ